MNQCHYVENAWVFTSVFHGTAKCNKTHRIGRTWEIGTHKFPIIWVLFLPCDSHPTVYFITWEIHGFPHQFFIVWAMAFRLICRSIIFSTCSKNWSFFQRTYRKKPDKVDPVKKVNSRRAGMKANYIKEKRGSECNFIQKEEYKYILGKSISVYQST